MGDTTVKMGTWPPINNSPVGVQHMKKGILKASHCGVRFGLLQEEVKEEKDEET